MVDEEHRSECLIVCRDSARVVCDEHTIKALTNERCVLNDRSKGGGAEVIDAVVEEDTVASSLVGSALRFCKGYGKPMNIIDKMVEGRIEKYYKEVCLMEQPFVKDPERTIAQLINEAVAKIGEKITVRRFVRYEMGEGLQKREDNFADEVMSQMKK